METGRRPAAGQKLPAGQRVSSGLAADLAAVVPVDQGWTAMSETKQARIAGKFIKIELPDDPTAALLVVEIGIDCPDCGQHVVQFAGHHARALRDLFIEA